MQAPVLWLRAVLTPKLRRSSNVFAAKVFVPIKGTKGPTAPPNGGGVVRIALSTKMILVLQEVTDWYRLPGDSIRDLFSKVKWPFKSLSDLQLEDQKVTLNHLLFFVISLKFSSCKSRNTKHKSSFEDYLWKYHVIFSRKSPKKNMLCWAADQKTSTILSSSHLRKKTKNTFRWFFQQWPKNWDGGETWDPNLRVIVSVTSKHREESSLGERLESIITESSCWILTLNNPQNFTVCQPTRVPPFVVKSPAFPNKKHQHTTNQPDRPNDPTTQRPDRAKRSEVRLHGNFLRHCDRCRSPPLIGREEKAIFSRRISPKDGFVGWIYMDIP